MGYKMKYTNGKKADVSAFPFKVESENAVSDSPVKLGNLAETFGNVAATNLSIAGGVPGMFVGSKIKGELSGEAALERKYEDEIAAAGLEKNFWGKIGFGGGNKKARAALIAGLQEQDQMGIDRERIASRGGVTAGA
jgi:hypothetical protein